MSREVTTLGIIGDPVAHSLSPAMHNAALRALGLDETYGLWPTPAADLPARVASLREPGMRGANVTLPHKIAVAALIDRSVDIADALGAVNTVVREADGSLTGHNTDAPAFRDSLAALGVDFAAADAIILGAGGAARAALWALRSGGCRRITLVNRTLDRALELAEGNDLALSGDDPRLPAAVGAASLLVNTTSLGWRADDPAPLPTALLHVGLCVYDMVYRPTRLLTAARDRGAAAHDGLDMLVRQAGLALELWLGVEAPLAVMRAAAEAALEGRR